VSPGKRDIWGSLCEVSRQWPRARYDHAVLRHAILCGLDALSFGDRWDGFSLARLLDSEPLAVLVTKMATVTCSELPLGQPLTTDIACRTCENVIAFHHAPPRLRTLVLALQVVPSPMLLQPRLPSLVIGLIWLTLLNLITVVI